MSTTIAQAVEDHVRVADLQPGDRLPPESVLANSLGVTRHQLRKAMQELRSQHKVKPVRGSGTYVDKGIKAQAPKAKTITVFAPIDPAFIGAYMDLQEKAFREGYIVSVVRSVQSSEFERAYLRHLVEHRPTGVMIDPSPLYAGVFDDIQELRSAGVKVAVLNAPPERRRHHAVFVFDYYQAAYQACVRLLARGFKRQVLLSPLGHMPNAWHYQDHRRGAEQAAADYDIELTTVMADPHVDPIHHTLSWGAEGDVPLQEEMGYVCANVRQAALLDRDLGEAGIRQSSMIAISKERMTLPHPCFLFDEVARLDAALRYLLDKAVHFRANVQGVIQPVFVGAGQP